MIVTNFWIINSTSHLIFTDVDKVPKKKVALVLGTSKYKTGGGNNLFFDHRMTAAAALYQSGKVSQIVLSGTKDVKYYDEPADMKEALLALSVPENAILLDNKGFRTFDSVINGKADYDGFVLVTQRYHAYRALFLSQHMGLDAVCYEAAFPGSDSSYLTIVREVFARPKAVIDLMLLRL